MDKREGSIIYDALAPCAMEVMSLYIDLENVLNESFADTSSREYLIKRASERGLEPTPASYAILKAEFNTDVLVGARFTCSDLTYIVTEKIDNYSYKIKCETLGSDGNKVFGTLIPIDYIDGLTEASLVELLIPGEDEEDTEVFRNRYLNSFEAKAFGGNKTDYIEKVNSISGVGATKVYPVWNGGGTVKLVILDSEYNAPTTELISLVQDTIDPASVGGTGEGYAPIGHVVSVFSASEINVTIETKITFATGYSFVDIETSIKTQIDEYFKYLRQTWQDDDVVIRISQIETRILSLAMVVDIENTKINGVASNLTLESEQIPIFKGVNNVN